MKHTRLQVRLEGISVAVRRGREPSAGLEALSLYADFDDPSVLPTSTVADIGRQDAFKDLIAKELGESLENPGRVHGWRVQALFGSVVVALGKVRLITSEDAGGYFYDDSDGEIKPPDFRIVSTEGQQLLVEVKAVAPQEQTRPRRLRANDVAMWQRYADLTGARLLVAHYWSAMNLWSLVSPEIMVPDGNKLVLSFEDAIQASEFGVLGDAMLGAAPPLTLSLIPAEPVSPAENGDASFTIADTAIYCEGRLILNAEDRRLAFFLMCNGDWQSEPIARVENGLVTQVDFVFVPQGWGDPESAETIRQQGFAMIGLLTSLHSTSYNAATLTTVGDVRALSHDTVPHSLSELVPDNFWNRPDRDLPIWKFHITPGRPRGNDE